MNYLYQRVADAASEIAVREPGALHQAFAAHLKLVADALHDVEWRWSGDTGVGDDVEAIRKVIQKAEVMAASRAKLESAAREVLDILARD